MSQQHAVSAYAKVVEVELRERIFAPFRKWAVAKQELQKVIQLPSEGDSKELNRYLAGAGELTLGQMAFSLGRAQRNGLAIFNHLAQWLRLNAPQLPEQLRNLETLTKMRNDATHGREEHDAQLAFKLATTVLNSIPSGVSSR
jgi:hypothetical protein